MDIDNLITMANRIGDFFEAMPDAVEARDGIANHIQKFWEPRMRIALLAHVDQTNGAGLHPMVLDAVRSHLDALKPVA